MRASRESGSSRPLFEPSPPESTQNHCIWPIPPGYPQDVANSCPNKSAAKCALSVGIDLDPRSGIGALCASMVPRNVQSTVGKNGNSVSVTQLGTQFRSRPRDCMRRAPCHQSHWSNLGRRQDASTREPGDQPCVMKPLPSGVTGHGDREYERRS